MDDHRTLTAEDYAVLRRGHLQDRRRACVEQAMRRCAGTPRRVLELGCGPGETLAELAGRYPQTRFLGVDVEEKMIAHARSRHTAGNLQFELRDVVEQRPDWRADIVYSVDVLHHVRDLPPFLAVVRGLLEPGGCWLVMEPNIHNPYIYRSQERMRRAGLDEDHFRPSQVEPLFRQIGFAIARKRYAFLIPGRFGSLPAWVAWLESRVENLRFLGGSVLYELIPAPEGGAAARR